MVWSGMDAHGQTPLVLVEGRMNAALYEEMMVATMYQEILRLFGTTEAMLYEKSLAPPRTA